MEFKKARVFTALNADEVKVGSKGFVAKNIRPYESVDELLTHFCKFVKPSLQGDCMPGVWVIEKSSGFAMCITGFGETDSVIVDGNVMSMSILLENYLYLDGTPCGIKE